MACDLTGTGGIGSLNSALWNDVREYVILYGNERGNTSPFFSIFPYNLSDKHKNEGINRDEEELRG
jgi:hypothetical protein